MVSILAVEIAANRQLGARYLTVSLAVFVLPFLLFAGPAGQIADRFSKTRVLQITKALEIVTMALGLSALLMNRIEWLLIVLFLLATQANFFSPAKYGILPEMLSEAELTPANGFIEFSTLAGQRHPLIRMGHIVVNRDGLFRGIVLCSTQRIPAGASEYSGERPHSRHERLCQQGRHVARFRNAVASP